MNRKVEIDEKLFIVVPAYNEAENIENLVKDDYSGRSAHALKRVQRMGIAV